MRWLAIFFLFPFFSWGLEEQPWLGDVYEFHFLGSYRFSYFSSVEGAVDPLQSTFYVHDLKGNLDFSLSPDWSIDLDLEFADTTKQSFAYRSFALQTRYLWADDIIGDWLSFVTGVSVRLTSNRALRDISSPYHGNVDTEVHFSLGKEFDSMQFWRARIWGFGALGFANKGSPWLRGKVSLEGNVEETHKWALFLKGGHGYGRKSALAIDAFHGFGKIRYKYMDIGIRYGYRLGVWGTLRFEYARRILAKLYPQNVNFFDFSYHVPFSF